MSDEIVARLRLYANARIEGSLASVFKSDLNIAANEIERLRAERDDARREVCEWVAMMTKRKRSTAAKDRGWDCFKVKDVDEWQMKRMREAINSLPSIPTCKEDNP